MLAGDQGSGPMFLKTREVLKYFYFSKITLATVWEMDQSQGQGGGAGGRQTDRHAWGGVGWVTVCALGGVLLESSIRKLLEERIRALYQVAWDEERGLDLGRLRR